jgi:hypothetical protein
VDESDKKSVSSGKVDETPDSGGGGATPGKGVTMQVKFARDVEGRIKYLEQELAKERYTRVNAERRQHLMEMTEQGFCMDIDAVMELGDAGELTDKQFERYAKVLATHASQAPIGMDLPTNTLKLHDPAPPSPPPGGPNGKERYRRDLGDKALRYCKARAAKGKDTTGMYELALDALSNGKPLPQD